MSLNHACSSVVWVRSWERSFGSIAFDVRSANISFDLNRKIREICREKGNE